MPFKKERKFLSKRNLAYEKISKVIEEKAFKKMESEKRKASENL